MKDIHELSFISENVSLDNDIWLLLKDKLLYPDTKIKESIRSKLFVKSKTLLGEPFTPLEYIMNNWYGGISDHINNIKTFFNLLKEAVSLGEITEEERIEYINSSNDVRINKLGLYYRLREPIIFKGPIDDPEFIDLICENGFNMKNTMIYMSRMLQNDTTTRDREAPNPQTQHPEPEPEPEPRAAAPAQSHQPTNQTLLESAMEPQELYSEWEGHNILHLLKNPEAVHKAMACGATNRVSRQTAIIDGTSIGKPGEYSNNKRIDTARKKAIEEINDYEHMEKSNAATLFKRRWVEKALKPQFKDYILDITVPEGVNAGDLSAVPLPDGNIKYFYIPDGYVSGDTFQLKIKYAGDGGVLYKKLEKRFHETGESKLPNIPEEAWTKIIDELGVSMGPDFSPTAKNCAVLKQMEDMYNIHKDIKNVCNEKWPNLKKIIKKIDDTVPLIKENINIFNDNSDSQSINADERNLSSWRQFLKENDLEFGTYINIGLKALNIQDNDNKIERRIETTISVLIGNDVSDIDIFNVFKEIVGKNEEELKYMFYDLYDSLNEINVESNFIKIIDLFILDNKLTSYLKNGGLDDIINAGI